MRQKAIRAGFIGRRLYEPGEQFDCAERMNWAEPVDIVVAPNPKPDKKGKGKVVGIAPLGDDEVI